MSSKTSKIPHDKNSGLPGGTQASRNSPADFAVSANNEKDQAGGKTDVVQKCTQLSEGSEEPGHEATFAPDTRGHHGAAAAANDHPQSNVSSSDTSSAPGSHKNPTPSLQKGAKQAAPQSSHAQQVDLGAQVRHTLQEDALRFIIRSELSEFVQTIIEQQQMKNQKAEELSKSREEKVDSLCNQVGELVHELKTKKRNEEPVKSGTSKLPRLEKDEHTLQIDKLTRENEELRRENEQLKRDKVALQTRFNRLRRDYDGGDNDDDDPIGTEVRALRAQLALDADTIRNLENLLQLAREGSNKGYAPSTSTTASTSIKDFEQERTNLIARREETNRKELEALRAHSRQLEAELEELRKAQANAQYNRGHVGGNYAGVMYEAGVSFQSARSEVPEYPVPSGFSRHPDFVPEVRYATGESAADPRFIYE